MTDQLESAIEAAHRGVAELRSANADLRSHNDRLMADLAQAHARVRYLEGAHTTVGSERDYYMRFCVELQGKLNDAAIDANDMADKITTALEAAKQGAYRPNGAAPLAELEAPAAGSPVIPEFLRLDQEQG